LAFGTITAESEQELGKKIAELHLAPCTENDNKFGFYIDNTIGSTKQVNTWNSSWVEFFRENRLKFQLDLIQTEYQDEEIFQLGEKLIEKLPEFFKDCEIKPSLLHGDLWSGNWAVDEKGHPVLFDPATYYGHSEMELSITQMFGGFGESFYTEYHKHIPKQNGFEARQDLYILYHYLNHMNIFGTSYRESCLKILKKLTS